MLGLELEFESGLWPGLETLGPGYEMSGHEKVRVRKVWKPESA